MGGGGGNKPFLKRTSILIYFFLFIISQYKIYALCLLLFLVKQHKTVVRFLLLFFFILTVLFGLSVDVAYCGDNLNDQARPEFMGKIVQVTSRTDY